MALVTGLAGPLALAAAPAHAVVMDSYCVFNYAGISPSFLCYETFNLAVSAATGGRLDDAPLAPQSSGSADPWDTHTVTSMIYAQMQAINPAIDAIAFQNPDFTGETVILMGGGCRASGNGMTWNLPGAGTPNLLPVNALLGMNNCSVGGAQQQGYSGVKQPLESYEAYAPGSALYGSVASAKFAFTPSAQQAVNDCASGAASCQQVTTGEAFAHGSLTPVTFGTNCTSTSQSETLTWQHTWSNTVTSSMTASVGSDTELNFGDIKETIKVSISGTYSNSATDTTMFSQSIPIVLPPNTVVTLWESPTVDLFSGNMQVSEPSGVYIDIPWTWTQSDSNTLPTPTWTQRSTMASDCSTA
jgi:hypothetical protein